MSMATRPRKRSRALPVPTLVDCPVGSEVLLPRLYDEDGEGFNAGDRYWEWARVTAHTHGELTVDAKDIGPLRVRLRHLYDNAPDRHAPLVRLLESVAAPPPLGQAGRAGADAFAAAAVGDQVAEAGSTAADGALGGGPLGGTPAAVSPVASPAAVFAAGTVVEVRLPDNGLSGSFYAAVVQQTEATRYQVMGCHALVSLDTKVWLPADRVLPSRPDDGVTSPPWLRADVPCEVYSREGWWRAVVCEVGVATSFVRSPDYPHIIPYEVPNTRLRTPTVLVSARGGAKRPTSSPTRGGGKCPVPAALSAAEEDADSSSDESGSDASGPDSGDSAPLLAPLCGDASSDESDPGDSVPASVPALVPLSGDDLGARSPVSRPARPRVRLGFLVMPPVPVGALPVLFLLWFPFSFFGTLPAILPAACLSAGPLIAASLQVHSLAFYMEQPANDMHAMLEHRVPELLLGLKRSDTSYCMQKRGTNYRKDEVIYQGVKRCAPWPATPVCVPERGRARCPSQPTSRCQARGAPSAVHCVELVSSRGDHGQPSLCRRCLRPPRRLWLLRA